jgi:ABC-type uncharacterized transport system substrate-binding protein
MNVKVIVLTLCALLFALGSSAEAQQMKKLPRIGFLSALSPSSVPARTEAFRQGLRDLGYVEGKNILIEYRYAEGKEDRLAELAAELVRLKVDVIVTGGGNATGAVKRATSTIPIVIAQSADPVADGFAASLARPGGNITGLSVHYPEISGKQVELLKEIVPKLSRLAVIGYSTTGGSNAEALKEVNVAAEALRLHLQYLDLRTPKEIETVFRQARKEHAGAVLVLTNPVLVVLSQRTQFVDLAAKNRLPAVYSQPEFVDSGGLMSYAASFTDLFRRAAQYVDKILKGAKPADLPVEQPTKFELVINLKTAKQIGLTIPPNVLARADRVIR